jgi:hypothetical protein
MRLLLLIATALAAGCASSPAVTGPVVYSQGEAADSVRIRAGETIVVEGIRVRFIEVRNDSRCPTDVVCVWAGDATVVLAVELNCDCKAPTFALELHTMLEPRSGDAHGFRIQLLHLEPSPRSLVPTPAGDYRAWIRLVRTT